jgi:hypothetical protein
VAAAPVLNEFLNPRQQFGVGDGFFPVLFNHGGRITLRGAKSIRVLRIDNGHGQTILRAHFEFAGTTGCRVERK